MRIAIIGAGPSGIAAGRELLRKGFTDFTILEGLDGPGGTWRLHTYPGLACDVFAHSYTFSYRPNPDWSENFVSQPEILAYLEKCFTEFGLDPYLRPNTRIVSADFTERGTWVLRSTAGETFEYDAVINAMGNQHTPSYPDVPGIDSFEGESFHGTRWDHGVDLEGKRVAVIGSAASAVQIVPEVAKRAAHLTVLQRSANWIMPRNLKSYSQRRRAVLRRTPMLLRGIRKFQGLLLDQVEYATTLGHSRMRLFEKLATKHIDQHITDPELREALLPKSRYGCKRGLVSDDFYPTLNLPHVDLIASGLDRITPTGLVASNGQEVDVDVIIYCTGYRFQDFDRIAVTGTDGLDLAQSMAQRPESLKGIAIPGFPNYFMAAGPNGLVLNVAYFNSVEQNVETIVRLLGDMVDQGHQVMAVKPEVVRRYNDSLAEKFTAFSWAAPDCKSYYRDAAGRPTILYPGSFKKWRKLHAETSLADFDLTPARATQDAAHRA